MKAILVIDMPSNCLDCPCEYDYLVCKAINHKLDYVDAGNERPSWCPLKPLPHKLQADWYTDGYKEGFNACLEEITGE